MRKKQIPEKLKTNFVGIFYSANKATIANPCNHVPDLPVEMMVEIFQYLPLKDLLSCRLVWKDLAVITKEAIGKKMKPILFNVKTEGLRDHLKNNPNSPVPDELHLKLTFKEDHESIKEICENLRGKIKHLKIDMNRNCNGDWKADGIIRRRIEKHSRQFNAVNARVLIHVLEILGGGLKTLEFVLFKSGFYQIANKMARKSCAAGNFNFPSVQKITICGWPPFGKFGLERLSFWNRLIFEHSGNLKFIETSVITRGEEINLLKDLQEAGRLTQITSIVLGHFYKEQSLNTLLEYEATGGLQIEELHINAGCKEYPGKMERVLKMQSKKLKSVSIECSSFLRDFKIPVMEQLTCLKLIVENYRMQSVCFNKITPNLKSLEVRERKETNKWMALLFNTTEPCKSLETLKIIQPKSGSHRQLKQLKAILLCKILARNFPCITSLTLGYPDEAFLQKLWTAWPDLRQLNLTLGKEFKDLDKSLFGINPEWKKNVDEEIDQWWTLSQPPPESQIQSICNLENLEVLRIYRDVTPIYGWRHTGKRRRRFVESNFSKFSYFYGLKHLKNLKLFSMNQGSFVLHKREVSAKARNFIRRELPSLRIHCKREKSGAEVTVENFFGV